MKLHSMDYEIGSFLTNAQGQLGLFQLLGLLQDAASGHAQKLGLGYQDMAHRKMFWVLTRQNLIMHRWPRWHDILTIKTWIRARDTVASNRDFRLYLNQELIGECTTSWLPLSTENRRPIAWDRTAVMGEHQLGDQVGIECAKIAVEEGSGALAELQVRNSDIDRNLHVNNTKYAQWILDSLPFEEMISREVSGYAVNFLSETKLGELIRIERKELSHEEAHYQGIRVEDGKAVFTALLKHRGSGQKNAE